MLAAVAAAAFFFLASFQINVPSEAIHSLRSVIVNLGMLENHF